MSGAWSRSALTFLIAIILAYLIIGTLFAVYTPAWQAPDEPAHYNYIRYLAEQKRLPILQYGDYPHNYLRAIVSSGFPSALSIDPIRYEFHQPPLYYLLAVPMFWSFDGALLPLRLLSVMLGAGLVYVAFRVAWAACPAQPLVALGTAALVAFVPMHTAMTAAVNNDTLAELLLALALWRLAVYARGRTEGRSLALVGLILGLGLLTKIYAFIGVGSGVVVVWLRRRDNWRQALREWAWLLAPALALILPWLVRNAAVYGWPDLMGLMRHDTVVEGQPTTVQWIADYGWRYLIGEGLRTTFHSFWGKFGWMAVVMDRRFYLALGAFVAVAAVGLMAWLTTLRRDRAARQQHGVLLALLALQACLTLLAYLWYNTKYVQHQGRYLFPALVPIGLAVAQGWWMLAGGVRRWMGDWVEGLFAAPFVGLAALDLFCLFGYVVPFLSSG